jgi:hypothetical protein
MPYAIPDPIRLALAFPANQNEWRDMCSLGVYHIPVMREKPGLIALSKIPRKVRRTIRPA